MSEPAHPKRATEDKAAVRIREGKLWYEVLRFGFPLGVGMALQTSFNLVDAFIIARLSPDIAGAALGAIGICDQLAALGSIISYGLSVATVAMMSRRSGEGDEVGMRRIAWQSLLLVSALGVVFGLIAIFGARTVIVDLVGAKGQVAELSVQYLRVLVGGNITIFLLLHLTSIQRALGSAKTPILLLVGANALNFFLSVVMVYGSGPAPEIFAWGPAVARALGVPRMDLLGAAWSTILARTVFLIPAVYFLMSRFGIFDRLSRERPDLGLIRKIVSIGWPSSAQLVVRILAMLLVHSLVARTFTTAENQDATTALGIVFRLETMALFTALGWGSAAQTFMGQNLGAGHTRRAKWSGIWSAIYNACFMGALAAIYVIYGRSVIGFFDSSRDVMQLGHDYFRWVAPSYVALGVGICLGSAMQGAGATRRALLLDVFVVIGMQVPAGVAAVVLSPDSATPLWQLLAVVNGVLAITYAVSYRRGKFLVDGAGLLKAQS